MGKDNRTIERYNLKVPVTLENLESTEKYTSIQTRDVSSGGVFIESQNIDLSAGSKVNVELLLTVDKLEELFKVSKNVLLKVQGQVTRATDTGIAVKFSSNYSITPIDDEAV